MSLKTAKTLIYRMITDEQFLKNLSNCKDASERLDLLRNEGFDVTSEAVSKAWSELSDDDLDKISGGISGPLAEQLHGSMFTSMNQMSADVARFANQSALSETDLIKFNMAASRYNMITALASNLVKELTDGEKSIAQKL